MQSRTWSVLAEKSKGGGLEVGAGLALGQLGSRECRWVMDWACVTLRTQGRLHLFLLVSHKPCSCGQSRSLLVLG